MAIDLGLARTGVAICDPGEMLASPVGTVQERDLDALLVRVADMAAERRAEMVVVGLPRNMDGSCGESAQRAAAFAEALRDKTGLPVRTWDERMTTVTAIGYLNATDTRGKKRKAVRENAKAESQTVYLGSIILRYALGAKRFERLFK